MKRETNAYAVEENLRSKNILTTVDDFGRKKFTPMSKPGSTAPEIVKEFTREEVDQESGDSYFIRMYKCRVAGKKRLVDFIADKYDENYKPAHTKKMTKGNKRGDNGIYKKRN